MKTEMKNGKVGTQIISHAIFRNQLGVTGNSLSDNKKNIMPPSVPNNYIYAYTEQH